MFTKRLSTDGTEFQSKKPFFLYPFHAKRPLNSFAYKMKRQNATKILDRRALIEIHESRILNLIIFGKGFSEGGFLPIDAKKKSYSLLCKKFGETINFLGAIVLRHFLTNRTILNGKVEKTENFKSNF